MPHSGGGTLLPVRNGQNQALLYADASDPQRHGADPGGYQGADAPHPQPAGGGGLHRQLPQLPAGGAGEPQYASAKEFYQQIVTSYDCRLPGGPDPLRRPPRKHALRTGRKVSQMDERYLRRAENALYGELAAALDLPEEEVLPYIRRTCPQWPE